MNEDDRYVIAFCIVWGPEIEGVPCQCLYIPRYPGA